MKEKIVEFVNHQTDIDRYWFPILFLRPKRNEKMTNKLVAILAVFYGGTGGISLFILLRIMGLMSGFQALLVLTVAFVVGFFIVFRLIVAVCWNYRADLLREEQVISNQ